MVLGGIGINEQQENINIMKIPDEIGYWLVRADGGKYYEDFFLNNFVSISDNNVDLSSIELLNETSIAGITVDNFKEIYQSKYPEWNNQQISHAASRSYKFYAEIKKGDLVLVPSRRSLNFLVGIVDSDVYEVTKSEAVSRSEKEVLYSINSNLKRRKVTWIKEISRTEISDKLYWILSAHQTIFNLEEDKGYINQLLSPIYIQNDVCHGTIKIEKQSGLNSDEWFELHSIIKKHSDKSNSEVTVKSNVQSPGLIEFVSTNPKTVFSLVMLLGAGIIGKVSFLGFKFEGILPYIQSHRKNQKELDIMEEDRVSKQLKNERSKFELEKDKENFRLQKETDAELRTQLQISNFDAGRIVGVQTQTDTLESPDSNELGK